MSDECLEPGNSLELSGGELSVKLAADSRIEVDPTDGIHLSADELSADWISWTPTFIGSPAFVLGNADVEAYYLRLGKFVFWKIALRLGSTSSMGTDGPYFDLPVEAEDWGQVGTANQPLGYSVMTNSSGGFWVGEVGQSSATGGSVGTLSANGPYAQGVVMDSSTPFTWVTGDTWIAQGYYEAV